MICLVLSIQMWIVFVLGCLIQTLGVLVWHCWLVICFSYGHDGCFGGFSHCLHYCLCCTLLNCHLSYGFLDCLVGVCHYVLYLNLPCVRLLGFYPWQNVMLPILKDDNTTGSWYLSHLFFMLCIIIISGYVYTWVHWHTVVMCTDGTIVNVFLCFLFIVSCVVFIGQVYFTFDMHLYESFAITNLFQSLFLSL